MNSWVFLAFSSSSQAEVVAESSSLRSYFAGLPHWACPIQTRFLEVLLFYLKPLSMYTQTFHVKAAAFNPADTKATWKASTIRKAIQKLRISLRSGKPHPPDFPGNLRQASLLMPSLLLLMVRMKTLTTPQWWGLGKGHLQGGTQTGQFVPSIFTHSSNGFSTFSTHHKPTYFGSNCLENDAKA